VTSPAPPDAALLAAYAGTVWQVHDDGGDLALRLDHPFAHPHLLPCAIITAYNPRSYPCEPSWNRAASDRLHATISERYPAPVPTTARGSDDEAGRWTEPGFLVSGIALAEAVAIAERFRQNAIVWVPADGRPVLVATRAGFLGLAPGDHIPIP
jgi:hypothetical protein